MEKKVTNGSESQRERKTITEKERIQNQREAERLRKVHYTGLERGVTKIVR